MKKAAKNFTKILFSLALVLFLIATLAPVSPVSAASKSATNKKAQKAFAKVIKNKFCLYTYIDIDKDGVTEMLVQTYSGKFQDGDDKKKGLQIYAYVKGKAKKIFDDSIEGGNVRPSNVSDQYCVKPAIKADIWYDNDGDCWMNVDKFYGKSRIIDTYLYSKKKNEFVKFVSSKSSDMGDVYTCYIEGFVGEQTADVVRDLLKEANYFGSDHAKVNLETLEYPSKKIINKYLKGLYKSVYTYLCKTKLYNKSKTSYKFEDPDGDGLLNMTVKLGGGKTEWIVAQEYPASDNDFHIVRVDVNNDYSWIN